MLELRELHWRQPRWNKRKYELHADDGRIMATFEQPSAWKHDVRVVFENRVLIIRPVGFWQTRVVARDEATAVDVAEYRAGQNGALNFKTGRVFRWRRKGFWRSVYSFTAADNDDVVSFARESKFLSSGALVTISPTGAKYPEIPVLLAFGWYLLLSAAANSGGS